MGEFNEKNISSLMLPHGDPFLHSNTFDCDRNFQLPMPQLPHYHLEASKNVLGFLRSRFSTARPTAGFAFHALEDVSLSAVANRG